MSQSNKESIPNSPFFICKLGKYINKGLINMTILIKEVKVKWNPTTREHYENLGYDYTFYDDEFLVPIEHLPNGSSVKVATKCDYCGRIKNIQYKAYLDNISNTIINKCSCYKCSHEKLFEVACILQKNGELTRDNKFYYRFKENRHKDLIDYLIENKRIDGLIKDNNRLYNSILGYDNKTLFDLTKELGFKWKDISNRYPSNHFKNIDNLIEVIYEFIDEYGYFPTSKELQKDLHIQSSTIAYHGGIEGIKEKLMYNDEDDYVDDRGYKNKSLVEYFVAQFLIKNKIHYKRESRIIKDRLYRSDFLITTLDGIDFHVEVWGFDEENLSERNIEYNKTRKIKEQIYHDNSIKLISIEYLEIYEANYLDKQRILINKFSPLFTEKLVEYDDISYLHPKTLSNDTLITEIMKYSENNNTLPLQSTLVERGMNSYLIEIRKRFGNYHQFAKYYNKELQVLKTEWNIDEVFTTFEEIILADKYIDDNSITEVNKMGISNILPKLFGNHGYTTPKLIFFSDYINNDLKILNEKEIRFIINSAKGIVSTSSKLSIEDIENAKVSLNKLRVNPHLKFKTIDVENEIELDLFMKKLSFNNKKRMEYDEYFKSLKPRGVDLLPVNFDKKSKYNIHSILKIFKTDWIDYLDRHGLKEEFINTMKDEFVKWSKKNNSKSLSKFCKCNSITYSKWLNDEIKELFWDAVQFSPTHDYSLDDLKDNFIKIKTMLNKTPLYNNFLSLTKISLSVYSKKLNLKGKVYDQIVKYYSYKDEYELYLNDKKQHKANVGRSNHQGFKYSNEELEVNFKTVFEDFYKENSNYPSKREFNKLSKIDDSLYRRRLNMKYSEVKQHYGY